MAFGESVMKVTAIKAYPSYDGVRGEHNADDPSSYSCRDRG
jgi:hypothetical protein